MRWKAKNYSEWHPHFAWLPKKINGEWIWLERIIRRGRPNMALDKGPKTKWRWEYVNSEFDLIKMAEAQKEMEIASGSSMNMAGQAQVAKSLVRNEMAMKQPTQYVPQKHPEQ